MRILAIAGFTVLVFGLGAPAGLAAVEPEGPISHDAPRTFAATTGYWTPERMRAARPLAASGPAVVTSKSVVPKAAAEQVDVPPTVRTQNNRWVAPYPASAAEQQTWKLGGLIAKTAGKVFGTGGGGTDFVASGNVVNSADGDVVVTVAHAFMDEQGRWSKNLVFVPAYKDGAAPYGKFAARTMFMWSGYYKDSLRHPPLDFGMLVVNPVKGKTILQTVGGQGIRFNATAGTSNLLLGYPSNGNGGRTLQFCSGASVTPKYDMKHAMLCDMGGGSSGGPWFQGFNRFNGTGYQVSAHALRNTTTSYGAFFGPEALKTYQAAEAA
ncbi:trypsin-like serine peptidase [Nonomuraea sp. LPB2021202275-12-8]|uniref:trypsin-like serine peptidase n=1 Tax=Nonomuraea sp. LPB2021202275-12-8 TaxID=3120159 RepID=UPI00300D6D86